MPLYNADCFDFLPTLEDNSVDAVITDPPYGTTDLAWDLAPNLEEFWGQVKRVVKPGANVVVFASQPFTSQLVLSNPDFRYCLVWDKNKCGSPGLANKRPMKTHEDVCVFYDKWKTYNPQMTAGEPYKRSRKGKPYVGKSNNHGYGLKPRDEFENKGTRFPKSVLQISRDFSAQQQVHPTQKPVPLLEWLVKTYTNEGDLVLDPFVGSGSTGLACKNLNREFVGVEKDETYFRLAGERLA